MIQNVVTTGLPSAPSNVKIELSPSAVTLDGARADDGDDVTSWALECQREDDKANKKTFFFQIGP